MYESFEKMNFCKDWKKHTLERKILIPINKFTKTIIQSCIVKANIMLFNSGILPGACSQIIRVSFENFRKYRYTAIIVG